MSRTALSLHLVKFQQEEERMVFSATDDSDREQVMEWYNQSKITPEDMLREYTPAEVRELCERTKVRVKMHEMNTVWAAKMRLKKEKRLENKSRSWVNKMLEKAESRQWVRSYSELEKETYKVLAACQTKKENNLRLDRWDRQRAKASKTRDLELSQPQSEVDETTMEQAPTTLESQPQSEVDETTMEQAPTTLDIQPVLQQRPNMDSEPNLLGWNIRDQDEVEESAAEAGNDKQPDGVDFLLTLAGNIHSESLSLPNTQSESDDEPFL